MITLLALFVGVVVLGRALRSAGPPARIRPLPLLAVASLFALAAWAAPTGLIFIKTVGLVCLPLGLFWLATIFYTIHRLIFKDIRAAIKSGACAVVITVVGNEPLGHLMMDVLEAAFQGDPLAAGTFDAVIVLGGGAQPGPPGVMELGPAGDRIFLGARLFHSGKTPLLVTTGTPIQGFQLPFDRLAATTRLWTDVGVPPDAIVPVTQTRTTAEEAQQCALLIRARGWKRVGLVSSAWHLRRATLLFAGAGVDVVPLAADHRGTATWEGLYSLIPTGNGAYLQQKATWEWIGAAAGR